MNEAVTHRILGGIRLTDAVTGRPLRTHARVTVPGVRIIRNRSGAYVLYASDRFPGHADALLTPPALAPIELTVTVSGLNGAYLPQQHLITLPRTADPAQGENEDSVFQPLVLPLFPAPNSRPAPGWATLYVTVVDMANPPQPLGGTLVQVLDADDVALGEGMTDWRGRARGEAFVGIAGIPLVMPADGNGQGNNPGEPVAVSHLDVNLRAVVDPNFDPAGEAPPNPALLRAGVGMRRSDPVPAEIGAGRTKSVTIPVAMQ